MMDTCMVSLLSDQFGWPFQKCYEYYTSGEISVGEDGVDEQCRWCGQGGKLVGCDFCNNAFCKSCIKSNLGRDEFAATSGVLSFTAVRSITISFTFCSPGSFFISTSMFIWVYFYFKRASQPLPHCFKTFCE